MPSGHLTSRQCVNLSRSAVPDWLPRNAWSSYTAEDDDGEVELLVAGCWVASSSLWPVVIMALVNRSERGQIRRSVEGH